ncbi:major facilitator superfamily domain-containing protein [Phascolomyces articulosus]|uniref:Major facilitator superfamily domain-containing protein n=1 Tax=Phascolomyces articulosus TaxID=60185 RepID=A0AAD5PGI5_9FUNG|nr:major facilitator superfamily domain-containing protein [Phascolomyces articulosus]
MRSSFKHSTKNEDNDISIVNTQGKNNGHDLDIEKCTINSSASAVDYTQYEESNSIDPKTDLRGSNISSETNKEKSSITIDNNSNSPSEKDYAPIDGGYGWFIACGGFIANFVMYGVLSIFGVIAQAYYTSILEGKSTTLQFMGIGCLIAVTINLLSPVTIVLVRFGTRFNYALGSILTCLGIVLAGFTTEVWHLYLTQGLLFGFGASFLYMSVAAVIPQWFNKRRATAMGLCSAGTGCGGLALSPFMNFLIIRYGLPWAYRILGFFSLGVCTVGTILIKDRLPSSHRKNLPIKSPIEFSMFKEVNFNIWLIGAVTALMGYIVPVFYIPKYTASIGLTQTDGSNFLAIMCAMNAIGRILLGIIADKTGRLNMLVICSLISGTFTFVIWPFATTYNILLVYCILWAPGSGMYYGLAVPITATVVGSMEKIGSGLSILFIVSSVAAMSLPIAAAIEVKSGFLGVQMFVGSVYVAGAIICLYLKYRLTGSLLAKY